MQDFAELAENTLAVLVTLRKKRGQSVSDGMSRASLGVFAVNTLAIGDEPVESESEANVSAAAKPPFSLFHAKHLP